MKIRDYPSADITLKMSRDEGHNILMSLRCSRAQAIANGLSDDSIYAINLAAVADRLGIELDRAREAFMDIVRSDST